MISYDFMISFRLETSLKDLLPLIKESKSIRNSDNKSKMLKSNSDADSVVLITVFKELITGLIFTTIKEAEKLLNNPDTIIIIKIIIKLI